MRTAQTVGTREMKFWDRIGIGIWTCTKNGVPKKEKRPVKIFDF